MVAIRAKVEVEISINFDRDDAITFREAIYQMIAGRVDELTPSQRKLTEEVHRLLAQVIDKTRQNMV